MLSIEGSSGTYNSDSSTTENVLALSTPDGSLFRYFLAHSGSPVAMEVNTSAVAIEPQKTIFGDHMVTSVMKNNVYHLNIQTPQTSKWFAFFYFVFMVHEKGINHPCQF